MECLILHKKLRIDHGGVLYGTEKPFFVHTFAIFRHKKLLICQYYFKECGKIRYLMVVSRMLLLSVSMQHIMFCIGNLLIHAMFLCSRTGPM